MILVFDLDDTLYPETEFVRSEMKAVSDFLKKSFGISDTYQRMLEILNLYGRGRVFNMILNEHKIYSQKCVEKCISIYRNNNPDIHLYESALICLNRFENENKYIVTDGNKIVQKRKIIALDINTYFKGIYITHYYGIDKEKPSTYCFEKIIKKENVKPNEVIYVGDNPYKDFIGIRRIGIRTIRVLQGMYKDITLSKEYEAEYNILSLDILTKDMLMETGIWEKA